MSASPSHGRFIATAAASSIIIPDAPVSNRSIDSGLLTSHVASADNQPPETSGPLFRDSPATPLRRGFFVTLHAWGQKVKVHCYKRSTRPRIPFEEPRIASPAFAILGSSRRHRFGTSHPLSLWLEAKH